jgi:hypothetical protein
MLREFENGLKDVASLWLRAYRDYATVPRLVSVSNSDDTHVTSYLGEDITNFDVGMDVTPVLTDDQKMSKIGAVIQYHLFDDPITNTVPAEAKEMLAKYIGIDGIDGFDKVISLLQQDDATMRENALRSADVQMTSAQQSVINARAQKQQMDVQLATGTIQEKMLELQYAQALMQAQEQAANPQLAAQGDEGNGTDSDTVPDGQGQPAGAGEPGVNQQY